MRKTLFIIAICGNEAQCFVEDGICLTWTDKAGINKLPEFIAKITKKAGENDLKTIISVDDLDDKKSLIVGRYEMNYITYDAREGDFETENPEFQEYIHKIQGGLF